MVEFVANKIIKKSLQAYLDTTEAYVRVTYIIFNAIKYLVDLNLFYILLIYVLCSIDHVCLATLIGLEQSNLGNTMLVQIHDVITLLRES